MNDENIVEEKSVYDVEKNACCFFYDHNLQPLISEHEEILTECAFQLKCILERMNLSFDEFYDYICLYSLGHGLDILKECNQYNQMRDNIQNEDYYMDF